MILYSNCSDYIYIYGYESYKNKDGALFLWFKGKPPDDLYVAGYVNQYDMLDTIIKLIEKNKALIVEYEPLNWPFDPETDVYDAPDIPAANIEAVLGAIEAIGYPPLYAEKPLIREIARKMKQAVQIARDIPGMHKLYKAYYLIYSDALKYSLRGAGLVTTISGIVPPCKGDKESAAVIVRRGEKICVQHFKYRSLVQLPYKTQKYLKEAVERCKTRSS